MAAGLSVFLGCEGLCCTLTASQRLQLSAEVLARLFLSSLMVQEMHRAAPPPFPRNGLEALLHADGLLGTGFRVRNVVLL